MKRFGLPIIILALLGALAFWWLSPVQVLKRRTATLLTTLTLKQDTGKAARQAGVYSLNALLASEVELENPTIKEANGSFDRSEVESSFAWLCEQAKQTEFKMEKLRTVKINGNNAEVTMSLVALVELPTYSPVDGHYDVTFYWQRDANLWRLSRAVWKEAVD